MASAPRPGPGELYTVKEIAGRAKVSDKTIRRLIECKKIGVVRVGDLIRISEQQYADWVRRSTIEPRL